MFPFWLIMLALPRHSPDNSTFPWPWDPVNILASPPLPIKTIQHKYAAYKGEKWEPYVWVPHVKSIAIKGMLCIMQYGLTMQLVSNPGTQQSEKKEQGWKRYSQRRQSYNPSF